MDATVPYSRGSQTKASLHFCQECNNLLYPKADSQRRIIVYACRICQYTEIVANLLVYRNDLLMVTQEQVGVTNDLGADATLAHSNIPCPQCGHDESLFANVSGAMDTLEGKNLPETLARIRQQAINKAVKSSANRATTRIVEVNVLPVQYVMNQARRIIVKAIGELAGEAAGTYLDE